jgi:hypothetical protein
MKQKPNDNFDHLFTPEVIAELDKISKAIKAGEKTYTIKELNSHLKRRRREWLRNRKR